VAARPLRVGAPVRRSGGDPCAKAFHSTAVKGAIPKGGDALPYAVGEVAGVVTPAGGGRREDLVSEGCFRLEHPGGVITRRPLTEKTRNIMNGFKIFSLFGVPVYVSIWYILLMGWSAWTSDNPFLWVGAVTFSILVHEFGHALMARRFRLSPSVLLHGWGGLCAHQRAQRDLHDVLILSAGPGAGLLLGGLTAAAWGILRLAAPHLLEAEPLRAAITYMLFINLFWSLINLIPMWPLDGGQLFRLGMVRLFGGARGERVTHITGIALAVIAGLIAWKLVGGFFTLILCGFLAYENYQRLQSPGASGPIRRHNKEAGRLVQEAQAALKAEAWREAARLAHVARDEGNLNPAQLKEIWTILAIATAQQGEFEEALGYIQRAPDSPAVIEAELWSLIHLHRAQEARLLIQSPRGQKLPAAVHQDALQALTATPS
jgi:stage IV sporulation protein FB